MSSVNQSQTTGSILDTIWIPGMTGHMNHRHTEDFKAYDLEIPSLLVYFGSLTTL